MIRFLIYEVYKLLTLRTGRLLILFSVFLCLGGCENDADTSLGEDGNYKAQSSCWQTTVTEACLKVINRLYGDSKDQILEGGATIIMLGFAIWMAFKLLKVLASFKEENVGEVWTEIGQKLFICAFCAYIVSNTDLIDQAFQTFMVPIYKTLLELGLEIINAPEYVGEFNLGDYKIIQFAPKQPICSINNLDLDITDLQKSITDPVNCLVCTINERLNSGIRIGITLICTLRLSAMVVGLSMVFLFTAAKFFFVLFLVDGLFRLNFAVFLLPILIAGVPFNFTRKWSKQGFLMFLNSSGIMMFMALLITLVIGALQFLLKELEGNFTEENIEGLGPILLALFLVSTLMVQLPGFANSLADKFIGGGLGEEFQKRISKFAQQMMQKAAAAGLSSLTSGVSQGVTKPLEKYQETREIVDNIKNKTNKIHSSLDTLAGYNDHD